jgi:Ca2+-dependent lipid-binding protein
MDSMALEGKACDPFCTIRFGGSGRVKTKAIKKTQNPVSRDMA